MVRTVALEPELTPESRPMPEPTQKVATMLKESSLGSDSAKAKLDSALYVELRRLAEATMRSERREHTLQPTALVHEAFMRLLKDQDVNADHRSHFLAASAVVMRRILVDHARGRLAQKRGGGQRRVTLSFDPAQPGLDVLDVHESLNALAKQNQRAADVVEKKFFGGMNYAEIGQQLGVSSRTVQDDWKFAKAWLYRFMDQS